MEAVRFGLAFGWTNLSSKLNGLVKVVSTPVIESPQIAVAPVNEKQV
jgi:hypothetical protein